MVLNGLQTRSMTTIRKVIPMAAWIVGILDIIALIGCLVLLFTGKVVPNELWGLLLAGVSFFFGGAGSKVAGS